MGLHQHSIRRCVGVLLWLAGTVMACLTVQADHWAYRPIVAPPVQQVDGLPAAATEIDRFLLAALRQADLDFSRPADKRTLIRRATFDLIGLPPTYAEVQEFLADDADDAFARVVDRLLKSPRYGERWGRHWLDLARYADTHGGAPVEVTLFPFSYTYRDYVIDAFNRDLPYDRFVREQIAADQLDPGGNQAALAGLGFLTVGRQYRSYHDTIDDRIDVVTRGLMGLNVTCARCHDHKYDDIPIEDYYSLYAVFAGSAAPDDLPLVGAPPDTPAYRDFQDELQRLIDIRENALRDQTSVLTGRLRMQVGMYLRELVKETPEQDLTTKFLSYRTEDMRPAILDRWREYMTQGTTAADPVFGFWHRCRELRASEWEARSAEIIAEMRAENGDDGNDPEKYHAPTAKAPRWNPRVLDALEAHSLRSMFDVSDAYGELFVAVQTEWLEGLLDTARQALPGAELVADNDPRLQFLNSAVNRQLRQHLYAPGTPTALERADVEVLNRTYRDRHTGHEKEIHKLLLSSPNSPPRAMTLLESPQPGPAHVFLRGNPVARGQQVPPRFLVLLTSGERTIFRDGRRRLDLAEAIVDPDNPLTTRFVVNWIWRHHFGRGLVRTPDNFGKRGEPPTHPELLDFLATNFVTNGWSIKRLHRQIMLSLVYEQSSGNAEYLKQAGLQNSIGPTAGNRDSRTSFRDPDAVDPQNRLLWRMPPKRLELEAMRDAMLAVAGVLDTTMGGRPIDLFAEPAIPRRTVYGFINRDVISSLFGTFDMADPSSCTVRRPETSVPQQALFALNSNFVVEQADRLAEATAADGRQEAGQADDALRVRQIYHRVYARDPDAEELSAALSYIHAQPQDARPGPWTRFAQVLLAANEFVFID